MRLFFSVGEPSGDQHAARLIQELQRRVPQLETLGFGGPLMEQVGFRTHYRLTDLAVMGFLRVVPLLWKFRSLVVRAGQILKSERPDAVVLVDFPGFNWWIARKAKQLGIPVIYYLPPQLWAWAPWRIRRVRKWVDRVLCALQFEQTWYVERGVAAEYVGHPFFDEVHEHVLDPDFLARWQVLDHRVVGVLPGSRNHEVAQNWPVMLQAIDRVAAAHPNVRFLVACFNESHRARCQETIREAGGTNLPIELFVGKTPEIIEVADCCLMVSGSVSLEMLARGTPAVVIYYLSWMSRLMAKLFVTCKFISLPNLMADRQILPEFLPYGTGSLAARRVAERLTSWLSDDHELERVREDLQELGARAGATDAISRAADAILRGVELSPRRAA